MPPKSAALSIEDAWNSVALEERIELISKSQAEGVLAALVFLLLVGATAYGFDEIWLLGGGSVAALMIMPLFANYTWRRVKPTLILSYLAVRSVARRYAYGFNIVDYDIVLIFRGYMEEIFKSEEEEQFYRQREEIDLETSLDVRKEVWICLMRGAVVILSEKTGGAKLEFIAPVHPDMSVRKPVPGEDAPERSLFITGAGQTKGRTILLTSPYPGALYVFEKQLGRLLVEAARGYEKLMSLRKAQEASEARFLSSLR